MMTWVSALFSRLFACRELHIPSSHIHYRNKIIYNLPLDTERHDDHYGLSVSLSVLADRKLNDVVQAIHDWACKMNVSPRYNMFREVMTKTTRDGNILLRVTVLRKEEQNNKIAKNPNSNNSNSNNSNGNGNNNAKIYSMMEKKEYADRWEELKQPFVKHMIQLFPSITCICYNETINHVRPTKNCPLHLLYGKHMHSTAVTHIGNLEYIIGVDNFCEVNHEVEALQNNQKSEWIHAMNFQDGAVLLCSGRDMSSWSLGFGSMRDNKNGNKLFAECVVVSHCPIVIRDAIINCNKHSEKVKCTVLYKVKADMASDVANALDSAIARQKRKHVPVCVIASGGRKGLNPSYICLLKESVAVKCIIYNSCSTKSLEKDMTDLLDGPNGFTVDAFRSYDFFGGTQYSASIMKLIRRPKTLIIPIGPAGVGKSFLAQALCANSTKYIRWHRDDVFASLKNKGYSMNNSKKICHKQLLEFLRGNDINKHGLVRILDSTNGNSEARKLYVKENQPQLIILVELRVASDDKEEILNVLLKRTRNRLEGGDGCHPSFPDTVEGQQEKHSNILKGIEYPTKMELEEMAGSNSIGTGARRIVHIICDPRDTRKLSLLPFGIFLECSTNIHLREGIGSGTDKPVFVVSEP